MEATATSFSPESPRTLAMLGTQTCTRQARSLHAHSNASVSEKVPVNAAEGMHLLHCRLSRAHCEKSSPVVKRHACCPAR